MRRKSSGAVALPGRILEAEEVEEDNSVDEGMVSKGTSLLQKASSDEMMSSTPNEELTSAVSPRSRSCLSVKRDPRLEKKLEELTSAVSPRSRSCLSVKRDPRLEKKLEELISASGSRSRSFSTVRRYSTLSGCETAYASDAGKSFPISIRDQVV
jgi:hypothetical protein